MEIVETHYHRQSALFVFIFPPHCRGISSDECLTTVKKPKQLPITDQLWPRTWVLDDWGRLSTKINLGQKHWDGRKIMKKYRGKADILIADQRDIKIVALPPDHWQTHASIPEETPLHIRLTGAQLRYLREKA